MNAGKSPLARPQGAAPGREEQDTEVKMLSTRTDAMQAGRDAFSAGKTLDDCPYTDPDLAAAWRTGMKEAAREAITTSLGKVSWRYGEC